MRTLLYTQEFPPFKGGVANYYGQMLSHWPEGEEIFVLTQNRHGRFRQYFIHFCQLVRAVYKHKIDYIIVGQVLPLGSVVHFFWRFRRLKYAVFLHGMDLAFALKHPRKAWLAKLILQDANRIICANSYTAEMLKVKFPHLASTIVVVNPGVSHYQEREKLPQLRKDQEEIILLSIGRLVKRKGFAETIKALPSGVRYVIIGQGPEAAALHQIADSRVTFIESVSEAAKWSWLEACDIFIMPSVDLDGDFEGFGIVYLEANLAGKPVIAGNSGGIKDAVIDGYNGLVVNGHSLPAIREAILKLASDPDLRHKLGQQGKARAEKDFSWSKQAQLIYTAITNQDK
ncbi:MAG: glycosyltransferase family 4 protein [Patescibacteria group bacterium]